MVESNEQRNRHGGTTSDASGASRPFAIERSDGHTRIKRTPGERQQLPTNAEIGERMDRAKLVLTETLSSPTGGASPHAQRLAQDTEELIDATKALLYSHNRDGSLQRLGRNAWDSTREIGTRARNATARGVEKARETGTDRAERERVRQTAAEGTMNTWQLVKMVLTDRHFRSILYDTARLVRGTAEGLRSPSSTTAPASSSIPTPGLSQDATTAAPAATAGSYSTTASAGSASTGEVKDEERGKKAADAAGEMWRGEGRFASTAPIRQDLKSHFVALMRRVQSEERYGRGVSFLLDRVERGKIRRSRSSRSAPAAGAAGPSVDEMRDDAYSLMGSSVGERELDEFLDLIAELREDVVRNDPELRGRFKELKDIVQRMTLPPAASSTSAAARRPETSMAARSQPTEADLDRAWHVFDDIKNRMLECESYRARLRRLGALMRAMRDNVRNDAELNRFNGALKQLVRDATSDSEGRADIFVMRDTLDSVRRIIVPVVLDQLRALPLPRLQGESADGRVRWALDNLTLDGSQIMPDDFKLKVFTETELVSTNVAAPSAGMSRAQPSVEDRHGASAAGPRVGPGAGTNNGIVTAPDSSETYLGVKLKAKGVQPAFRRFQFAYDRDRFPRYHDNGVATVEWDREGMDIEVKWALRLVAGQGSPDEGRGLTRGDMGLSFELKEVDVDVGKMRVTVHDAKHRKLDKFVLRIFRGAIRNAVEDRIEEAIERAVRSAETGSASLFERARSAAQQQRGGGGRLQTAANSANRFVKAVQKSIVDRGSELRQTVSRKTSATARGAKQTVDAKHGRTVGAIQEPTSSTGASYAQAAGTRQ